MGIILGTGSRSAVAFSILIAAAAVGCGSSGGGATVGAAGPLRLVAWSTNATTPSDALIGSQPDTTSLVLSDGGRIQPGTVDLLVNGQSAGVQSSAMPPWPIGRGAGWRIWLMQAPPAGSTLEVHAKDTQGNAIVSNTVVVQAGPLVAGAKPPSFVTIAPADGSMQPMGPPSVPFTWTPAAAAQSYLVVSDEMIPVPAHPCVLCGRDGVDWLYVEVPAAPSPSYAPGQTAATVFGGGAPPGIPPVFQWQVIALDATGWGIGTTIDVDAFAAALGQSPPAQPSSAAQATWPTFLTK
jgi:hypothetical protein